MPGFNKSRHFFDCEPNCERRKPGCQDHCERYLKKRAELDALNAAEKKRKEAWDYTIQSIVKKKDQNAKRRKDTPKRKLHP